MSDPKASAGSSDLDIGITSDFLFEGGAEAVVDLLCETYPDADVYTAIYDPDEIQKYAGLCRALSKGNLTTSFAQRILPLAKRVRGLTVYHFYWLYFIASTFQRARRHDIIFVSCCAQSKLIRIPKGTQPVVYFHTPTRWLYPGLVTAADLEAIPGVLRAMMTFINMALRPLDQLGIRRLKAHNPVWLCNSSYVRDKVNEFYGVDCRVVYPPVDVQRFSDIPRQPRDFFLYHGRLTFQKRVDVAIRGCLLARKRLIVSGSAVSTQLQAHLEQFVADAVARDASLDGLVTFLGRTSDNQLKSLFAECSALIFPPREDFGITPVEAIASGVPVIAYQAGGALDYIKPGINGRFFAEQTGESLAGVLQTFDAKDFAPADVKNSIPDFSSARFQAEIQEIVSGLRKPQSMAET